MDKTRAYLIGHYITAVRRLNGPEVLKKSIDNIRSQKQKIKNRFIKTYQQSSNLLGEKKQQLKSIPLKTFADTFKKTFSETTVGLAGMKVDWKFFEKFEHVVKSNTVIKQKYEQGDVAGAEEYVKNEILEKPEDYFNLDKLRKSVKADRRITLKEFIEKIFGSINKFKSKDELLEDEFEKFVNIYKPDNKYILAIKNYLKAYITDSEIRDIVETKEYSRFATNPKVTMQDFRELNGYREVVPEYVKDYVSINAFM